jgi:hypothetical protein
MDNIQLTKALEAFGVYPLRPNYYSRPADEAYYILSGRTHYVDAQTLRYFKARILRTFCASGGLFFILQESLPHPDFGWARVRRNVVFDVFGDVIGESRETCHTNGKKADAHFNQLIEWTKSAEALEELGAKLERRIKRREEETARAAEALATV